MDAIDRNDPAAMVRLLHADAFCAMPPLEAWYVGNEAIVAAWIEQGFGSEAAGRFQSVRVAANKQPAVAVYRRRPNETGIGRWPSTSFASRAGSSPRSPCSGPTSSRRSASPDDVMDVPNGDQNFQVRRIVVAPGAERPYDEAEWKDALVVIESGKLELESRSGNRSRFDRATCSG